MCHILHIIFLFGKFLTRPQTGLSWLIGSSLHDILTSIIFLFVRHPFDVGDKIDLGEKGVFTVKEIRLLSTILLNGHGGYVQVSNNVLAELVRLYYLQLAAISQHSTVHSKYSPQPQGRLRLRLLWELAEISCSDV